MRLVVARRRDDIDGPVPELDLRETVRPVGEVIELLHTLEVVPHDARVRLMRELGITSAVIQVPVRVDDE